MEEGGGEVRGEEVWGRSGVMEEAWGCGGGVEEVWLQALRFLDRYR